MSIDYLSAINSKGSGLNVTQIVDSLVNAETTPDRDAIQKKIDSKNNTYYRHNIEGCPDLANSIFVTPTSPDPWIPYEVFCEKNVGRFTHKDVLKFADRVCNAAS